MTKAKFKAFADAALALVQSMSPYDTGNLRKNAIRLEWNGDNEFSIFVNESIAPYMPYTNEKWEHKVIKMGNFRKGEVVERLRTWDNPNEGWWNDTAEKLIELIVTRYGGRLQQ